MKKALLILISLILCLTMLTGCFSSVEEIVNDAEAPGNDVSLNNDNSNENNGEVTVNPVDKQLAVDSFNKIDLAAFAGTSFNYMDVIKELALAAEFEMSGTVDGSDGAMSLNAAVKDGVIYLKSEEAEKGYEPNVGEYFVKLNEATIDIFGKYVDGSDPENSYDWTKNSVNLEDAQMNTANGILTSAPDMLAKIVIPKLTADDLTEKDGMLLVSNEYIFKLTAANYESFTGEKLTDDQLEEDKKEMLDDLDEAGFALYIGTGTVGINKVAVSFKLAEEYESEEQARFTKVYGELALTADSKALDYITVKIDHDYGVADIEYAPESVVTFKTILDKDNMMVGAELDATLYVVDFSDRTTSDTISSDAETYKEASQTNYLKVTLDAMVNLDNIGEDNTDIATLDLDMSTDKVICVVEEVNAETYESTIVSATEEDVDGKAIAITASLKSVNDKRITLDCAIGDDSVTAKISGDLNYTVTDEKLEFNGSFKMPDTDLDFSGSINAGDFTMPALPNIQ